MNQMMKVELKEKKRGRETGGKREVNQTKYITQMQMNTEKNTNEFRRERERERDKETHKRITQNEIITRE